MSHLNFKTVEVKTLTEQVYRVRIQPQQGKIFAFKGGQYLYLLMLDGKKIPLSIASSPEQQNFIECHIRLIPGHPLAAQILELFQSAKHIHIEGPCGECFLNDGNNDVVIIVGGTGFSPMKSLIESAIATNNSRQFSLYVGAQQQTDLYQSDLVESWDLNNFKLDYIPVINEKDTSWNGAVGFPHEVALKNLGQSALQSDFYISGSEVMVVNVYRKLLEVGVSKQQIFSDILDIKREMDEDF